MASESSTNATTIFAGNPTCSGAPMAWCRKTRWLITDKFIEYEAGLCCPSIETMQILRIKDISFRQRCCCANCGVITINSSDTTTPVLIIAGLPNSKEIFTKLREAMNKTHGNAKLEIDV